jgi:hypothetical protein
VVWCGVVVLCVWARNPPRPACAQPDSRRVPDITAALAKAGPVLLLFPRAVVGCWDDLKLRRLFHHRQAGGGADEGF